MKLNWLNTNSMTASMATKLLISFGFLPFFVACGPVGMPNDVDPDAKYQTGGYRESENDGRNNVTGDSFGATQVSYTISGNTEQFERIRYAVMPTLDVDLSKKIKNVVIQGLDEKSQVATANISQVKITVAIEKTKTENWNYLFAGSLQKMSDNKTKAVGLIAEVADSPFGKLSLDLNCFIENCESAELILTNSQGKKAGVLYRTSHPKVSVATDDAANEIRSASLRTLKSIKGSVDSNKVSVAVVSGPSFARIEVPSEKIEITTPILDTRDERSSVDQVSINGDQHSQIQGTLVGNDPETGSVVVDIHSQDTDESARLFIEEPALTNIEMTASKITPPTVANGDTQSNAETQSTPVAQPTTQPDKQNPAPVTTTTATTSATPRIRNQPTTPVDAAHAFQFPPEVLEAQKAYSDSAIFKGTLDLDKLPNATKASMALAQYAKDPEAQRMVRVWLGFDTNERACGPGKQGNYRSADLINFISRAPVIADYVKEISEKLDVTPEIAYLLALESNYLKSDEFSAIDTNKASTSVGPWQILKGTALAIKNFSNVPFQVFNTEYSQKLNRRTGRKYSVKVPNENDDRGYFQQSTYMAALYLQKLFKMFSYDPGLAVMAYHSGEGDAGQVVSRTDRVTGEKSSKLNSFTQELAQFKTSLNQILKYRIQARANCTYINYAYSFIGLRTIGQNIASFQANVGTIKKPKLIRLEDVEVTKSEKFKTRLSRPNGPLPE